MFGFVKMILPVTTKFFFSYHINSYSNLKQCKSNLLVFFLRAYLLIVIEYDEYDFSPFALCLHSDFLEKANNHHQDEF